MTSMHAGHELSFHDSRHRSWILAFTLGLVAACGSDAPEPVAEEAVAESVVTAVDDSAATKVEAAPEPVATVVPVDAFWASLETLCGKSYRGQLTIGTEESDREFGYADMVMYSKRCDDDAIDIGFKVNDDDSRTWMFRRSDQGLSLHHRHVDKDGNPDDTSGYGGVAQTEGTAIRQEFPADENTGQMIPAAATNVWAIEVKPDDMFAYELQRIEQQRMFRVVFDLTEPL
ncbi:MAG: hypothetical protein AAGF72_17490 [Pseudomonadota bacterium]